MPAVDLPAVRQMASGLPRLFAEPEKFLGAYRQLLEATSDPSYRQSVIIHAHMPLLGYGTPLPVIRTVVTALKPVAVASPAQAQTLAEALWAAGSREERRLAAELIGLVGPALEWEALKLVERWLPEVDSLETADVLAAAAFGPLLLADPRARLLDVRRWVNAEARWTRRASVTALGELARAKSFQDVGVVLDALRGALTEPETEVKKAVAAVLRDLTPKGPGEVGRFLRDWAQVDDKHTRWMVKRGMTRLDGETQAELSQLMRERR